MFRVTYDESIENQSICQSCGQPGAGVLSVETTSVKDSTRLPGRFWCSSNTWVCRVCLLPALPGIEKLLDRTVCDPQLHQTEEDFRTCKLCNPQDPALRAEPIERAARDRRDSSDRRKGHQWNKMEGQ